MTNQKAFFTAAVSAVGAVTLLTYPATALALPMIPLAPACDAYQFSGLNVINQANGYRIEFGGGGPQVNTAISSFNNSQAVADRGTVVGRIKGRDVDFTVTWNKGTVGRYLGSVNDQGFASGTTRDQAVAGNVPWNSASQFDCFTPAAAPAPAPAPAPPPVVAAPPPISAPAPVEQAKPLKAPTVTFSPVTGGVAADIKDNSGIASNCTYTSGAVNRTFSLPANGTAQVRIVPLLPLGVTYNVNVNCDNGTNVDTTTTF